MIRNASLADVERIIDLACEAQARSIYAGRAQVDRQYARALFSACISRQGIKECGGALFLVSEKNGVTEGYIFAVLARVYAIGDKLSAVDGHMFLSDRADRSDFVRFVRAYNAWADGNPNVIEAAMTQTNILGVDPEKYSKVMRRYGFEGVGMIYKRKIER